MEGEITETILKLKGLLSEKYGEDFRKFYLVNDEDNWQGLITKKQKGGVNPGEYYSIRDEEVMMMD
jgi:hypothetical protein